MAVRPVFVIHHHAPFFRTLDVEFVYNRGLSASQKRKNICAIHDGFNRMYPTPVLEISSKSMQEGGKDLSAFNLPKYVASLQRCVSVECAYQAGKVFQNGGPYTDLLSASPRDAKHDPRLKNSGALVAFAFEGQQFPLKPLYLFYNFLYISALLENPQLAEVVLQYSAFTDIEFGPNSSVNCQAAAAAVFVSLHKLGLLEQVKDVESYYKLLTDTEYAEELIDMEQTEVVAAFSLRSAANITAHNPAVEKVAAIGKIMANGDDCVEKEVVTPAEKLLISKGDTIIHQRYGCGKVVEDTTSVLTIVFPKVGMKLFDRGWIEANCEIVHE